MSDLLSDDEVFGGALLSDEEVFGAQDAAARTPASTASNIAAAGRGVLKSMASIGMGHAVAAPLAPVKNWFTTAGKSPLDEPATPDQQALASRNIEIANAIGPYPEEMSLNPRGPTATALRKGRAELDRQRVAKVAAETARPGKYEGVAGDLWLKYQEIAPTTTKMVADAMSMAPGVDLSETSNWAKNATRHLNKEQSREWRATAKEFEAILNDSDASPAAMVGFLLANLVFAAAQGIPSLGAMALGGGAGAVTGLLGRGAAKAAVGRFVPEAVLGRATIVERELTGIQNISATAGASATEAMFGAGSVYRDVIDGGGRPADAALAAANAALGYGVIAKFTRGGAEGALARRATPDSRTAGAVKVGLSAGSQEGFQSLVESGAKAVGLDQPFNPRTAAKQAIAESVSGVVMGAPVGALQAGGQPVLSVEDALIYALETGQTRKPFIRSTDMPTTPFTPEQVGAMAQAAAVDAAAAAPVSPAPQVPPVPSGGATLGASALPQGSLADIADQQLRARSALPDVPVPAIVAVPPADAAGDQPGRGGATVGRVADAGGAGQVHPGVPAPATGGDAGVAVGDRGQPNPALTAAPGRQEAPFGAGFAVGGGLRTQEIPLGSITLSKDVPQFKIGANAAGVVEPLGGAYDRTGTAPIQLWQRTDGRLEVISGRHRLDLAHRSGEATIPAQVHREADGFNTRMASGLDAELNIRDGQGKVRDYVDYFKARELTQAEAEQRGLLARATGKRAYVIATMGGDELIAAHRAVQLTDEAAVAIAESAPGDSRLQAVGIRAVQDGKSIAQAANTVRAVKLMAGEQAGTSGDMFGFDDSAMREAEQMAKVATARQRDLSQRLASISGAAKNPALAKSEGVNVNDPSAVLKRATQIKQERSEWDNWPTNPRLVAEIRAEIRGEQVAPTAPVAPVPEIDATNAAGLEPSPTAADPLKTRGQAVAQMAERGLAGKVEIQALPKGAGFVFSPILKKPSAATAEADRREIESANEAMLAWRRPDGSPWNMQIAANPPMTFRLVAAAMEVAWGVRTLAVTGGPGQGLQWKNRAYVNVDSLSGAANYTEMLFGVTGHEVKHWLDANDPKAAKVLTEVIAQHLRPDAVSRQQAFENRGLVNGEKAVSPARARLEVDANINGAMWLDPEFWGALYEADQGSTLRKVLYQFMRAATRFINVTAGGQFDASVYVTDVAAVRAAAVQAWTQRGRNPQNGAGASELMRTARDDGGDFNLTAPTRADVLAQQEAKATEKRDEIAGRRKQDEQARKDREQRDIADRSRQDASAESFQLGQGADESLGGQGALFSRGLLLSRSGTRADSLSPEDRAIETRLKDKIDADFDAAVAEYSARPDAMGGKVLNTDIARELSPDYMADRTKSAAVHEPASQFVKDLYARNLAQLPSGKTVVFTSGGTGAGKTTGIADVPVAAAISRDAGLIYDTNMNTMASAVKKVKQALDAGMVVRILHVQRDPVEALVNGALSRAKRQEQEFGTGRTVPLVEHARTHAGAAQVLQQLSERYKDDPRVDILVIDNTHGKGNARMADLGFVRGFDYNGTERKLHEALTQEHDAGRISGAVFRATAGDAGARVGAVLRPVVRGQPEPQRDGGSRTRQTGGTQASATDDLNDVGSGQGQDAPVLSRTDPFADNYAALSGRKVRFDVLIQDSGKTARFTVDAGQFLRDLDERQRVAERLRGCVG